MNIKSKSTEGYCVDDLGDHLANERTFLAWTRTGLTIFTVGCAVARFGGSITTETSIRSKNVQWKPVLSGFMLGVCGVMCVVYGVWRYYIINQQINRKHCMTRLQVLGPVVATLILTVAMIAILIVLFIV